MGKFIDLTGKRFGKLVVIKIDGKSNDGHLKWICKCDCGNIKSIIGKDVVSGKTKSCGCLARQLTSIRTAKHNMHNTKIYYIWNQMKQRCTNSNHCKYNDYGGRGIKICDKWSDKENGFMNFYNWAMQNGYKEELSIDRIDNNGKYEPSNCRWTTAKTQANNRRSNHYITYQNTTHTINEWSQIVGIPTSTIYRRIKRNVPTELLFSKNKIITKRSKKEQKWKK